jgi:hypothetical protein
VTFSVPNKRWCWLSIQGVQLQKDLLILTLVVPQAAITALLVAGLAQWVSFVWDRWQCKLCVQGESAANHVDIIVTQYREEQKEPL